MKEPKAYVTTDEQGVMRVGEGGVPLDSIIAAFEQGHTAETIRSQYPDLSLEEVYGAIAYYLGHREEVEEYLKRQDALWEQWRTKLQENESPVVKRLRAMRQAGTERGRLEALLWKRMDSGPSTPMTDADFDAIRKRLDDRAATRQAR